jgi:hypothetical protein
MQKTFFNAHKLKLSTYVPTYMYIGMYVGTFVHMYISGTSFYVQPLTRVNSMKLSHGLQSQIDYTLKGLCTYLGSVC